jgi:hypothetical protein
MGLVGGPGMLEAARTTTSTFGIWAIIVVAVILLGVWLVGISIADNMQTRESRRWKQRHRPEPESALGSEGVSEVPGQRRGDERAPERPGVGHEAAAGPDAAHRNPLTATATAVGQGLRSVLNHNLDPGRGDVAGHEAVTDPTVLQQPTPEIETRTAVAQGRHAKSAQPTLDGAGDFRKDSAQAQWRTEAPTRPDLPAQTAPTGRHAMPAQRSGDADRAQRTFASPDADRQDDDTGQG